MGWQELLIILFILLLIFGAGRLTGLGSALGRTVREFRDATDDETPKSADTTAEARTPRAAER